MSTLTTETTTKQSARRAPVKPTTQRKTTVKQAIEAAKGPRKISDLVKKRGKPQSTDLVVTVGADPECAVFDTEVGHIVSSIPVLKCGKHNPIDLGGGVALFADSTLCEFNMKPAYDRAEFLANMRDALTRVQAHLGDRYRLYPQAAHHFTDEEMIPSYDQDPMAVGCNPSVDCLREALNQPQPFTSTMRTGSFHLHLGNDAYKGENDGRLLTYDSRHDAIKLMNLFVGLGTVVLSQDKTSAARRTIYGKAYEARITPYGVEYRTTEPYPLRSPEMVGLVYDLTTHAMGHMKARTEKEVLSKVDLHAIEAAINGCDKDAALTILKTTDLPTKLIAAIQQDNGMPDLKAAWSL